MQVGTMDVPSLKQSYHYKQTRQKTLADIGLTVWCMAIGNGRVHRFTEAASSAALFHSLGVPEDE